MTTAIGVTHATLPVDAATLADRVRPAVEAGRARADELRMLPPELLSALRDAGAFRLFTPHELGGFEVPLATALRVFRDLARIDTSVAWTVMNANLGALAAVLPPAGLAEIWAAGPDPVFANSTRPRAGAVPDGDSFVLDGSWNLVSGARSADWAVLLAPVLDGEGPAITPQGFPDMRLFVVPRDELEIVDSWDVTSLRGSDSNTVRVSKARVPRYRVGMFGVAPTIDRPLYRVPMFGLVAAGLAAVVLGAAEAALAEVRTLVLGKPTPMGGRVAESPAVQATIGRTGAELRAAALLLEAAAAEQDRTATEHLPATTAQRGALRAAMSHAGETARRALTASMQVAGSSALYRSERLESVLRDGQAAAQHGLLSPEHFALAGRIDLGLEPGVPLF